MSIEVTFPGNKRVDAQVGEFTVKTDQPAAGGGDGSAPAPFDLFLASIATCAGIYALGFMQQRGIEPKGSRIIMDTARDPQTGLIGDVRIELKLPTGFPEQYREAVVRSMDLCAVKKHINNPPRFEIVTTES